MHQPYNIIMTNRIVDRHLINTNKYNNNTSKYNIILNIDYNNYRSFSQSVTGIEDNVIILLLQTLAKENIDTK